MNTILSGTLRNLHPEKTSWTLLVDTFMEYVSPVWMAMDRRAVIIASMPEASLSRNAIQPLAQRTQFVQIARAS